MAQARHDAEATQRARYQAVVGSQFADQPDRHPHRVSHYGYLVFRPRAPLGYFDQGVETFTGTSIFLEAHRQNTANFSAASQSGGAERFGEFTPASALQLFLPLFLFGVAGVSVTREREAGTLPLLLCQGLSWPRLLWGKACGCLLIAASVVAPATMLLIGWMAARGELAAGAATALYPIPARAAFDSEVDARVRGRRARICVGISPISTQWLSITRLSNATSSRSSSTRSRSRRWTGPPCRATPTATGHDNRKPLAHGARGRALGLDGSLEPGLAS